jgi:hypothetical protein
MIYYIFLKSLRSLGEFRKNPHVKIPPKSPSTNFQSLAKFKNPIFNSEILFPCFWPGRPYGPLGLWPSRLPLASPLPQAEAHRSAQAAQPTRGVGVIAEVRFLLGFTSSILGAFSLPTADMGDPLVSSVFPTMPADPGRETSAPPLPASPAPRLGCRQDFTAPLIIPLLNPPSNQALAALMAIHPAVTPAAPPGALPWPYKSHPDDPRSTPHLTVPFSSPAPETLPTEFPVTSSCHRCRPVATPPPELR